MSILNRERDYYQRAAMRADLEFAAISAPAVEQALRSAPDAENLHMTTHSVGCADNPHVRVIASTHLRNSSLSRADRDALVDMARVCDGEHYHVDRDQTLATITMNTESFGAVQVDVIVRTSIQIPLTRSEKSLLSSIGKRIRVRESRIVLQCGI